MHDVFRWSILTALVVSLVTFALNFATNSLGIKLIAMLVLTIASVAYFMKRYGVPDTAVRTGGIIGLAAMTGLVVVMTTDILEYVLTLILFLIGYGLGALVGRFSFKKEHRKREDAEHEESENARDDNE